MSEQGGSNESKLTAKDFYNEMWHCRDFELSHLWQRSVFLGAFMLAIATGYGALALVLFGSGVRGKSRHFIHV